MAEPSVLGVEAESSSGTWALCQGGSSCSRESYPSYQVAAFEGNCFQAFRAFWYSSRMVRAEENGQPECLPSLQGPVM